MKIRPYIIGFFLSIACYSQASDFNYISTFQKDSINSIKVKGILKEKAKIRLAPSPLSDLTFILEKKDTVELIDYVAGYWVVEYKEKIGYVSEIYLIVDDSINTFKDLKTRDKNFENNISHKLDSLDKIIYKLNKTFEDTIRELEKEKGQLTEQLLINKLKSFEKISVQKQWELLLQISGCLVGGQYCRNGVCGSEGCIMSINKHWIFFLNQPKSITVDFLINEIGNLSTTETHTCPFQLAKTGELAIYSLQFIYKTNWYDLSPYYKEYKQNETTGADSSYQAIIWRLIENPEELKKMKEYWRRKMK